MLLLSLLCFGRSVFCCSVFFFNDTATTEIYTLSLHDALPIYGGVAWMAPLCVHDRGGQLDGLGSSQRKSRSEEHTSELQSLRHLVCRLLLEKKKRPQRRSTPDRDGAGDTATRLPHAGTRPLQR